MAKRNGRQTGQSLTELAIVLPLFLVVTFGIIDASRLIYAYNAVSLSAREGVRWAVVRGATSGRPASAADVSNFVRSMSAGVPVDVSVSWDPPGNNQPGSAVVVTVQNDFATITRFPGVPSSIKLASTSRMIISR